MPSRFWKASGNALLPSRNTFAVAGGGGSFSPDTISGVQVWLEADPTKLYHDAGVTLATDGQTVKQMNAKGTTSVNYDDAGFGTTLWPTLHNPGGGVKPKLTFNGSANTLGKDTITATDANGQHWGGICLSIANFSGFYKAISLSGANNIFKIQSGASSTWQAQTFDSGNTHDDRVLTAATPCVLIWAVTWNGTSGSVEFWLNNVSDGPTALGGAPPTGTTDSWIASDNGGSGFCPMDFYGLVRGTGTLSSTDRGNLQTYLAALHP